MKFFFYNTGISAINAENILTLKWHVCKMFLIFKKSFMIHKFLKLSPQPPQHMTNIDIETDGYRRKVNNDIILTS